MLLCPRLGSARLGTAQPGSARQGCQHRPRPGPCGRRRASGSCQGPALRPAGSGGWVAAPPGGHPERPGHGAELTGPSLGPSRQGLALKALERLPRAKPSRQHGSQGGTANPSPQDGAERCFISLHGLTIHHSLLIVSSLPSKAALSPIFKPKSTPTLPSLCALRPPGPTWRRLALRRGVWRGRPAAKA